jgi:signal peptidase I
MPPPDLDPPEGLPGGGTGADRAPDPGGAPIPDGSPVAVADGSPATGTAAGPERPGAETAAQRTRRRRRWLFELGAIVVVAVVLAVLLRVFVVQVYYVPSTSMLPTLRPGDRIMVDKLSFHLHPVARGDIVVFSRPPREHQACGGSVVPDLVKRVIGLPGQTISSRGNQVLIDGKPIPQPWLPKGTQLGRPIPRTVIPANDYYVLGDHRDTSCDSRYWGVVPRSTIVGEVVAVLWPPGRIHFF